MVINYIVNQDCIEGMKLIQNNTVDLIVTDPPYLINYKSNRRTVKEKFDFIANDIDSKDMIISYLKECYRILKDNTSIYMFCSWHHVDFFKQEFEKHFKLKNIIIWNKNNHGSGDLTGSYAPKHEFILYGHKGRDKLRQKRIPDIIDYPKITSSKLVHPTQKPIGLLNIFINNSSDIGDIVFDGFMGSGATAVASKACGRNHMGFEIDGKYCDLANSLVLIS